jgi:hypothetical protein
VAPTNPTRPGRQEVRRPSARVGRNRRCAYLYAPLVVLGALAVLASFPVMNAAYLVGVTFLIAGAAGFVYETGTPK